MEGKNNKNTFLKSKYCFSCCVHGALRNPVKSLLPLRIAHRWPWKFPGTNKKLSTAEKSVFPSYIFLNSRPKVSKERAKTKFQTKTNPGRKFEVVKGAYKFGVFF